MLVLNQLGALATTLPGMARTDNDSWDLATSVGATATMVAAGRARATRADNPLIEDRFAEPLVRAVGIDFFTRWAAGELDCADVDIPDAASCMQRMTDLLAVRTRYIDVQLDNRGYPGECNDVTTYLDSCGWHSVGTSATQLLADNGLAVPPAKNGQTPPFTDSYFCTSTLHKATR